MARLSLFPVIRIMSITDWEREWTRLSRPADELCVRSTHGRPVGPVEEAAAR